MPSLATVCDGKEVTTLDEDCFAEETYASYLSRFQEARDEAFKC